MARSWRDAIEEAFTNERGIADLRTIVRRIYQTKAFAFGDALNSELKSLLFASRVCANLLAIVRERVEVLEQTEQEQRLVFTFATDAILASYNALRMINSPEAAEFLGSAVSSRLEAAFKRELPQTVEAADAIRHHHDRAFGRVKGKRMSDRGQMISHWGAALKLTDRDLNEFYYDFGPVRVERILSELAGCLDSGKCA